nr:epoxyqueuosine reductase [Veillonella denticariosi]
MTTLTAKQIHDKALECGFDDCGIISIDALDSYKDRLAQRLEAVPESEDIYAHTKSFLELKEKYPWAQSIVVCTEYYGNYKFPVSLRKRYAKGLLLSLSNIPRSDEFKRRRSFETWLGENGIRYIGGETAKPAGIIPLRPASVAAGLGIYRKNNFFYGPKGSSYELVAYLIDEPCEYIRQLGIPPCPDSCDLCQQGCKIKSLSAPFTMNPLTCVSFINTFGDGKLPDGVTDDMLEAWILGCDNCRMRALLMQIMNGV